MKIHLPAWLRRRDERVWSNLDLRGFGVETEYMSRHDRKMTEKRIQTKPKQA